MTVLMGQQLRASAIGAPAGIFGSLPGLIKFRTGHTLEGDNGIVVGLNCSSVPLHAFAPFDTRHAQSSRREPSTGQNATPSFRPKRYPNTFILHVRTHGDPSAIIQPMRQLLQSIDPTVPFYQVATLSEKVDRSLWQERSLVALASCFGMFAIVGVIAGGWRHRTIFRR